MPTPDPTPTPTPTPDPTPAPDLKQAVPVEGTRGYAVYDSTLLRFSSPVFDTEAEAIDYAAESCPASHDLDVVAV